MAVITGRTVVPYEIVTPSHLRTDYMSQLLSLIPNTRVFVDESEADEYSKVVPDEQISTHRNLRGMPQIRNHLLDASDAPAVVMIDDDFRAAYSRSWQKPRKYTDPEAIRAIIECAVNVCADLDKTLFTWTREQQVVWHTNNSPFSLTFPISCGFIFYRGTHGKNMRFDESLQSKGDLDMSFQGMLHDRVILLDRRWFMDFGVLLGETGGEQARRTSETQLRDERLVKAKWKKYAELGAREAKFSSTARKSSANVAKFVMRVPRRSPLGYK